MKLMKILTYSIAIALLIGVPSYAQSSSEIVSKFDDSTVSRLLLDVDASFDLESGPDGQNVYRARVNDEIAFTLSPRACSADQGCLGLLLIAVFRRSDGRSLTELDNLLNRYNDLNPNGKVYRMADGTVVLQGYINAAYGIGYSNAQAQLLVFGLEVGKVREALTAFSAGQ